MTKFGVYEDWFGAVKNSSDRYATLTPRVVPVGSLICDFISTPG